MSQIYKINYVNNNEIKKIFVFVGSNTISKKKGNPEIISGEKIFTESEWKNITADNIPYEIICFSTMF